MEPRRYSPPTKESGEAGRTQELVRVRGRAAYAMVHSKAPGQRNAEITLVREVTRWRAEVERFAPGELAGFDALIAYAVAHPAELPQRGDA